MVSDTNRGSGLVKTYQMEVTTIDFSSHGLNLTSALRTNFADSVQETAKDAIKRKLTARVSPMTRQIQDVYDPKIYSQASGGKISHGSIETFVKQEKVEHSATAASCSRSQKGQKRLQEKRKSPVTSVIIPAKSVNSNSTLHSIGEEPTPKRNRTILPRTSLSQGKIIKKFKENLSETFQVIFFARQAYKHICL